jgi:hypothetical protein
MTHHDLPERLIARPAVYAEEAAQALRQLQAENEALRKRGNFAGWFMELRSGMTYRLWEQGGAEWQPGYVALYE